MVSALSGCAQFYFQAGKTGPDSVKVGQDIHYRIAVEYKARGVFADYYKSVRGASERFVLVDWLPKETTLVSLEPSDACQHDKDTVRCEFEAGLDAAKNIDITVRAPRIPGTVVNHAVLWGEAGVDGFNAFVAELNRNVPEVGAVRSGFPMEKTTRVEPLEAAGPSVLEPIPGRDKPARITGRGTFVFEGTGPRRIGKAEVETLRAIGQKDNNFIDRTFVDQTFDPGGLLKSASTAFLCLDGTYNLTVPGGCEGGVDTKTLTKLDGTLRVVDFTANADPDPLFTITSSTTATASGIDLVAGALNSTCTITCTGTKTFSLFCLPDSCTDIYVQP